MENKAVFCMFMTCLCRESQVFYKKKCLEKRNDDQGYMIQSKHTKINYISKYLPYTIGNLNFEILIHNSRKYVLLGVKWTKDIYEKLWNITERN